MKQYSRVKYSIYRSIENHMNTIIIGFDIAKSAFNLIAYLMLKIMFVDLLCTLDISLF